MTSQVPASVQALPCAKGVVGTPQEEVRHKNPNTDCDGIATLLAAQLTKLVSPFAMDMINRAHWFVLRGTPMGDNSFINIYAPKDSKVRCRL